MVDRYRDHVVLVTGGAQGLGRAMVERFAAEGATVRYADLRPSESAWLRQSVPDPRFDHVDVTDRSAVGEWVGAAAAEHGRIDVLVNNAGIIRDNRLEHISAEDWEAVVGVSLTGTFNCTQAVFPYMKARAYGRIVSFSSMSWRGNFGQANYVAAKAGIVGLTRTIALEGARHGITANAIAPGLIETPMLASMNSKARATLISKIPRGETGDPQDIASAAAYLCSEEAGYITGVVLDVDGGISIGSSIR